MNAKQKRAVVFFIGLMVIIFSPVITALGMDFAIWLIVAVVGLIIANPVSMLLYRKWKAEEVMDRARRGAQALEKFRDEEKHG